MEVWRDIIGYEGWYQVSDLGNVRSLKRTIQDRAGRTRTYKGKLRALSLNNDGYLCVSLTKYGRQKVFKAHRLVAVAFIPNPNNKPEVNHIDGIKSNNKKENLEWVTHAENVQHAISTGINDLKHLDKANKAGTKALSKLVLDLSTGIFYDSCKEASESIGIKYNTLKSRLNPNKRDKNNTSLIYV